MTAFNWTGFCAKATPQRTRLATPLAKISRATLTVARRAVTLSKAHAAANCKRRSENPLPEATEFGSAGVKIR
jgi:hypothetical protein